MLMVGHVPLILVNGSSVYPCIGLCRVVSCRPICGIISPCVLDWTIQCVSKNDNVKINEDPGLLSNRRSCQKEINVKEEYNMSTLLSQWFLMPPQGL
jgi:hypothetical protein